MNENITKILPDMPVSIGMFDSGLGGLSVWKQLVRVLPEVPVVYVSDSAYCPYGPRPVEEVIERASSISEFLINKRCNLIVVACNTATAAAIDVLRERFLIPFVGMEPAVKPAALHSQTGVVGVLATRGTFKGRLYQQTSQRFASHVQVLEQVGEGLVELVEQGRTDAIETEQLLRKYIEPMMAAGADHLVLGCTHYPFLIPAIERITMGRMVILDSAPAVVQQTLGLWQQQKSEFVKREKERPQYLFYATGAGGALEACYRNIAPAEAIVQFCDQFLIPNS